MYKKFEQLLQNKKVTAYQVAKATGITKSTFSDWKAGRYTPKSEKLQKIADYFGVSISYFTDESIQEQPTLLTESHLSPKEERDIAREAERIMANLSDSGALMFDGDPMSDEARESMLAAMKLGLEAARLKNKEKYTPKKYKGV